MIQFNKEFNIGHILTSVVLFFGVVGFAYALKSDIQEVALKQDFSTEVTAALNRETLSIMRELREDSDEFDDEAEQRLDSLEQKMAVIEDRNR